MTVSVGPTRWTNNASTTLNGGINGAVTSLVVTSALGFPNPGPFRILIDNELMQVTGGYGTATWTVARGVEGTAAAAHLNLAAIIHDVTAFELNALRQEFNIMAYGPVGNGVADEATVFQNATNDAHAAVDANGTVTGGVIFLPPHGTYKLNSNLTTYSNVLFVTYGATITGSGAASVAPLIRWSFLGALTLPAALTVQSGGAVVTGAVSSTSTLTGTAVIPTGLTGATQASRYVGSTTTGAPVSGTFAKGDFVITQDGFIYVCTTAGTPGTWQQPAPSLSYGANIQPLGTLSGGADAAVARDDHIHPTTNVALLNATNVFTANNTFSGGITGTVQTVSQGNITTVGTLTGLTVGGTAQFNDTVTVDANGANVGTSVHWLQLGGVGSGEGIASKRSSGGNQFGIDLYSGGTRRFYITLAGNVGIVSGSLIFDIANPTISSSSYVNIPGGAYFSSGTVYTEAAFMARGGIQNDSGSGNPRVQVPNGLNVGNPLALSAASSKIIPGATQLSLRNNADNADNLIIADGGALTARNWMALGGTAPYTPGGGDLIVNRGGNPGTALIAFGGRTSEGNYLYFDGTNFTFAKNGAVTGLSATMIVAAQPNITSLGTLTSLTMGGTLAKGGNALTGSRNGSDIYPFVQGVNPTGVQIWIQSSDPGGSANEGDLWFQA